MEYQPVDHLISAINAGKHLVSLPLLVFNMLSARGPPGGGEI